MKGSKCSFTLNVLTDPEAWYCVEAPGFQTLYCCIKILLENEEES